MLFRISVLGSGGAHEVPAPLIRRNLRDGAYRAQDRFLVAWFDPVITQDLSRDGLVDFFALLDADFAPQDKEAVVQFLKQPPVEAAAAALEPDAATGVGVAAIALPDVTPAAPEPELPQVPPPAPEVAAPVGEAAPAQPPPAETPAPGSSSRPMLVALLILLTLGGFLFWPRTSGERRPTSGEPAVVQSPAPPVAAPAPVAAPEVFETRFVRLDAQAYTSPDAGSPPAGSLARGQRVSVVASGGTIVTPEGWLRLSGDGGYATVQTLSGTAPPRLMRTLNDDVTLPVEAALYGSASLEGRPQRTLAAGQLIRVVGLVNPGVAEVRIGMELGYVSYGAVLGRPTSTQEDDTASNGRTQTPQAIPRNQPRNPPPPPPSQGPLVLGVADLARPPSSEAMWQFYPPRARRSGVGAQVAFQCEVVGNGRLTNCHIWRETVQGYGFSDATIRLVQQTMRVRARMPDGRSTEGAQFRGTITWRTE